MIWAFDTLNHYLNSYLEILATQVRGSPVATLKRQDYINYHFQ